jgi:HK97 family phage major capsid protein
MTPIETVIARMAELKDIILERAAADVTTETPEMRAEFDAITAEWDELEARKAELESRIERAKKASAMSFNVNTLKSENPANIVEDRDVNHIADSEARGRALEIVERNSRKFSNDSHADDVARLIERGGEVGRKVSRMALTLSSDEYRDAWLGYMSGKHLTDRQASLLERGMTVERAFTAGTGSSGGFMVPLFLDPSLVITGAGIYNPIRDISTVKQISTLTWNSATAAQVTAGVLAENAAFSDNTPTVSQVQIPTYKMGAYLPASFEAFEDIDALASDAVALFMDAKANLEGSLLATGTGSSQPKGVMTAVAAVGGSRVSPTTGGTFGAPDIFKVHSALPARYRRGGRNLAWLANVGVINAARQFGTSNVYYAYLANGTQGQPDTLLGEALYEQSALTSTLTTGNDVLLFGDFSKYYIIDRVGATTEFIPNVFDQATGRPSGTRAWLFHWRFGANCADTNAFRDLRL